MSTTTVTAKNYVHSETLGKISREEAAEILTSGRADWTLRIGHGATRPVWLPASWKIEVGS